jgi:hypothetical protein
VDGALTNEPSQTVVVIGPGTSDRLEPGDGATAIDDHDRRAALDAVDQRAEVVLGLG